MTSFNHYHLLAIEADLKFKTTERKLSLHEVINRKNIFRIGLNSTIQLVKFRRCNYIKNDSKLTK